MAKSEEKRESRIQTKKKSWYRIISPKAFGQKELGEAYLTSPDAAIGRCLRISLKDLSGNVRDQNVHITFRVISAKPSELQTDVIGYELTPSAVRRSVRKGANRIDGYFTCPVKNGIIVVKTLLIPLSHTNRPVQHALRKKYQNVIAEEAQKLAFEEFMGLLTSGRLRSLAKKKLDKIYPCRDAAIRTCFLKGTSLQAAESSGAAESSDAAEPLQAVESSSVVEKRPPALSNELIENSPAGEAAA